MIEDNIKITRDLYLEEIASLVDETYRREGGDDKELLDYFIAEVIRIRDKYKEAK